MVSWKFGHCFILRHYFDAECGSYCQLFLYYKNFAQKQERNGKTMFLSLDVLYVLDETIMSLLVIKHNKHNCLLCLNTNNLLCFLKSWQLNGNFFNK